MIARDGGGVTTVCVDDTKTGSVKNDSEGWGGVTTVCVDDIKTGSVKNDNEG